MGPKDIMKKRVALALVGAALLAVPHLGAQHKPAARPAKAASKITPEQALPMSCVQAWVASGKSYPEMLAVVKVLARVSLANRDLTLPNTRAAGIDAGKGIAADCKADPDALLFAVVDKHVRRVAQPAVAAGG